MDDKELDLSVLIPAYREEENLRLLLPRLNRVLQSLPIRSETLVVDADLPMDGTRDVCAANGVAYLCRAGGGGYGYAYRTGIARARGKYILIMDADGSHEPETIPELWKYAGRADVVVASRYAPGGRAENSALWFARSRLINWAMSRFLSLECRDLSNSYKLYEGSSLKELRLKGDHADIIPEIVYRLSRRKSGFTIKEVPFVHRRRQRGSSRSHLLLRTFSYLVTCFRLRLEKC